MDRNLLDYRASSTWEELMFEEQQAKKPWRKVALAVFLCLAGASMLIAGICLWYNGPGQGSGAHIRNNHAHYPNSACMQVLHQHITAKN